MGLFHHKQSKKDSGADDENQDQFFDEYFREELRNRGRWYFEKVITENRRPDGGHILFRPVGLRMIAQLVASAIKPSRLEQAAQDCK